MLSNNNLNVKGVAITPPVVKPIGPKDPVQASEITQTMTKEQFNAVAKKVEGGRDAIIAKIKEIHPSADFAKLLKTMDTTGELKIPAGQLRVLKRILPEMNQSVMVSSAKSSLELKKPLDPIKANAQIAKYKDKQVVIERNIKTQTAERDTKLPTSKEYKILDKSIKSLQKDLQISKVAISVKESGIKAAEELPKLPGKIQDLETKLAKATKDLKTASAPEAKKLERVIDGLKTDIKGAKDEIINHKYTISLANGGLDDLLKQRSEIRGGINKLTQRIPDKTGTAPAENVDGNKNLGELFAKKEVLSSIDDKILKLPNSIKAGSTEMSVKGFQASKTGENLIQKVMSTKIYETGDDGKAKVSTMLRDDKLAGLSMKPKVKDQMKPIEKPVEDESHEVESEEGHDDHQKFGWENVKARSVGTPSEMISLISYRKAFVDQLMKEVKQEFQVEGNMRAVGSTNLTSDYDATILGLTSTKKGEEGKPVSQEVQAQIVAKFNEEFRKEFGVESGTAFDTNIYVDDFELNDKKLKMDKLEPKIQAEDNKNQDSLALVKQRIHMTDDQWGKYVSSVVDALPATTPDQIAKKVAVQANYDQANTYATARQEEIDKKIVTLNTDPSEVTVANLSKTQIKELAAQIKHDAGPKAGDIEAQALNRLYEEKLVAVKKVEDKGLTILPGPDGKPTAEKQKSDVEVKKLKGEALFFANEPYFSEGGVRHIVGNLQKLSKEPMDKQFEITPAQAIQSVSENIGDTMKEFNHFSKDGLGTLSYKASKYINRLADAITLGTGKPEGAGADKKLVIPDGVKINIGGKDYALKDVVAELKAINKPLLEIRGEKVGKELDGEGKAELALNKFNETATLAPFKAVKSPAEYQKLLLDITSQVNIALRK